jgi:hypothetical protein
MGHSLILAVQKLPYLCGGEHGGSVQLPSARTVAFQLAFDDD